MDVLYIEGDHLWGQMVSRQAKGLVSTNDGRHHTINSKSQLHGTMENWNNYKRRNNGHVSVEDSTIKTCQKKSRTSLYSKKWIIKNAASSPFSLLRTNINVASIWIINDIFKLCQKEKNIRLFNKEILCSSIFHRIFLSFLPSLFFCFDPHNKTTPINKKCRLLVLYCFLFCFFLNEVNKGSGRVRRLMKNKTAVGLCMRVCFYTHRNNNTNEYCYLDRQPHQRHH